MQLTNTKLQGVIVDSIDGDLDQYRWCWATGGYIIRAVYKDGGHWNVRLHREILERIVGRPLRPDELGDHINGNKLDNRRANLRIATSQQNSWNRSATHGSRSQYIGVWLSKRSGRWASFVKRDGIRFHIGYFDTQEEAAWMRDQWALALHGEFARLNFEYVAAPLSYHPSVECLFDSEASIATGPGGAS